MLGSTDLSTLHAKQSSQFLQLARDVADSDGTMVRRSMNIPLIEEAPRAKRESVAAIRVADLENRAGDGFSFSREEFEFAIRHLDDGKQGHRSMFNRHFHRQSASNLPVI